MAESQDTVQDTEASEVEAEEVAGRILGLVRELALELRPYRELHLAVELDSQLDRDLGFDSLGRAELILRTERTVKIHLPESLLAEAETPRDLVMAVLKAQRGDGRLAPTIKLAALSPAEATPGAAGTLTEILDWHVEAHPERPHIVLTSGAGEENVLSYRALRDRAQAVARGLLSWGLEPGERVAIMLPTGEDFFFAFYGTVYAGGIPVPIYPPMRLSQIEDHLERQARILDNAGAALLITVPEARALAVLIQSRIESLRGVDTVEGLTMAAGDDVRAPLGPADTALIQYTSGSTGDPKGVVLSHANLLANIRALGQVMNATSSDVFVSWLPLYHDMGLIGAWLGCLYFAVPTVILSPLSFLARPATWLWALHNYRGTFSGAPNFAFELCLKKITDEEIEGLDLSSLREIVNGAEPVSPETLRAFTARFAQYGFRSNALAPVYGLAECSVGLTFPPSGRPFIIDRVDRGVLTGEGEARPAAADDAQALEVVACGQPLPGHQVRVVDETGHELGERHEGLLQFRGPSSTSGYFRNEAETRKLFDGDWLDTGDLAYIAGGDIFLTGRVKDLIIRAGRNIYPQEVEEAVGNLEDIRKGCVAVFGSADLRTGTERVIVMAETRVTDEAVRGRLRQRINEITTVLLESPPEDVVLAPPHTIPKTSSGKIRRAASKEIYESGRVGARTRALWWQFTRLALSGVRPQLRRWRRAFAALAFAAYWWALVAGLAAAVWPLVVVAPVRRWRWAVVRGGARLLLRLTGTELTVEGGEALPRAGGLIVTNHASYFDSLALVAALPGEVAFVAKQELAEQVFAGLFLRRLGIEFVERFDAERGVEDIQRLATAATAATGRRLVFYPEGTLTRRPGLLDFRLGAFTVAADAGVPVIPITLRGTRTVLRGDQWFPRRGAITVTISPPLEPEGGDWNAAVQLRDRARAVILENVGEPDLAGESAPALERAQANQRRGGGSPAS